MQARCSLRFKSDSGIMTPTLVLRGDVIVSDIIQVDGFVYTLHFAEGFCVWVRAGCARANGATRDIETRGQVRARDSGMGERANDPEICV